MRQKTLGDQELALLRFVSESGPITAGEAAARYGEPNGLARSTVETVLTRLNRKGYLSRVQGDNGFRYEATAEPQEVMGDLVDQFVANKLGGSLVPLVNYFVRQRQLSEAELAELQRLVANLEAKRENQEP